MDGDGEEVRGMNDIGRVRERGRDDAPVMVEDYRLAVVCYLGKSWIVFRVSGCCYSPNKVIDLAGRNDYGVLMSICSIPN
jgi:hypothetical protein